MGLQHVCFDSFEGSFCDVVTPPHDVSKQTDVFQGPKCELVTVHLVNDRALPVRLDV